MSRRRRLSGALLSALRRAYRLAESGRSPLGPLLRGESLQRVRQRLNAPRSGERDVVEVLDCLEQAAVPAWLIGGWGTDALLGELTRAHEDIDLIVPPERLADARAALERNGFRGVHEVAAGSWLSLQIKLVDATRRFVALHPVEVSRWSSESGPGSISAAARELGLDPTGAELFTTGRLAGRAVPVLGPVAQLVIRCGYQLRDCDRQDVAALCSRFGLVPPRPYADAAEDSSARP